MFHTILRFRTPLQASFNSACITLKSHLVKPIFDETCYQIRTSSLTHVREGAPYPPGYLYQFQCEDSLLAPALVHALSMALPQPILSLLLSFTGDASPSVDLLALFFQIPRFTTQHSFFIEPLGYKQPPLEAPRSIFRLA